MNTGTMKAVFCTRYGDPEVLQLKELPIPYPKKGEILVRIIATAVNSGDVRVRGLAVEGVMKLVMRLVLGWSKPRKPVLGTVFSGIVEALGEGSVGFQPGEAVFGMTGFQFGTYAEYITVKETGNVIRMPEHATFEEVAALPFGGQTAIYFLEKVRLRELTRPRVLIYGATGSVGVAAIQLAKHWGGHVTAVCSFSGLPLASELGADEVIAYDRDGLNSAAKPFDLVFDAVGKISKREVKQLLKPNGKFLSVAGLDYADENRQQLELLKELVEVYGYKAVIDRSYPLAQIVEAHRYVDTGRKKGNVVVLVSPVVPLHQTGGQ